ncbi:putative thiol:disulfide interchange protein [Halobacteriovorax marinus SJ]|uniref:Thiol:disulfide interchange protein n=1 Tax=Halobacteriovorax marinus (strain ATCC BAA-682 / DSM 15412 / SJ) TaxID=862908 RepID=E1X5J6_HALMS|nr:thioredoxin family protein [Halobacteriovorax marinus]CBW27317.1 putative thiol:disulfide interchange protein [Halobacteriovorax marinus SJ]
MGTSKLQLIVALLLTLTFSTWVSASGGEEDKIPDIPVKFAISTLKVEDNYYLALNYENFPHWHTYWKNPGDAGLPLKFDFQIDNKKESLTELEWPTPKKYIEEGDMLAFGYEKQYSIFFKLPKNFSNSTFKIDSNWLVCKHICIPGKAHVEGSFNDFKVNLSTPASFEVSEDQLKERFEKLPRENSNAPHLDLVLAKDGKEDNKLVLYYNLSSLENKEIDIAKNILTPFPHEPFNFIREKVFKDKKGNYYAKYNIEWDGEYMEPEIPLPKDGKFKTPYELRFLFANPTSGQTEIIKHSFHSFSLTASENFNKFTELLTPVETNLRNNLKDSSPTTLDTTKASANESIFFYLLLAFVGGLILNFMPCVLPVISIKLFGLIQHRSESKSRILKHNLSYTLGILTTFVMLTVAIIALKSAGEQVGWGFQLQSPVFVLAMIVVLFVFALNLFGLFEFRTPGGSKLGGLETNESFFGDFSSGVLATILSTPCSAPFLGTALTFAFTSSNFTILAIFLFVGLGLAFPFLITGFFPATISFLPKPGMWMENLKKFLGLTLLLTIIWLIDVFSSLTDHMAGVMIKLNTALLLCFFAFYLAKKITKSKLWIAVFHILYIALFANILMTPKSDISNKSQSALLQEKNAKGLQWEKWSEDKMKQYAGEGKKVFIDFTAKWCFTCKVNERLVIETSAFKKLVDEKNVQLLLADWTKRDEVIGSWLKKNGYVGVPAYFVINSKGELIDLGETISISEISESLN